MKTPTTKLAKVAILCMSTVFLCNYVVAQNTFTVTENVYIKDTKCTKTFNCYYGDNDERIMHGLCKTVGKENIVNDKDHKYSFSHTESINYSHGKKEGAYSFQQKESTTTTAVYTNYQTNRDYVKKSSVNKSKEITGSYKNDERDGVWKETIKGRDTLWEPYSRKVERTDIEDEKNTFVYSNGKLVELTTKDAHYKFRYASKDGRDIALLNGNYDKYTVKDGIIVSHIVRLNGDETPIEDDIKQFIDSKENLFEHQDELLEKGYILVRAYSISYKQRPNIDEFDYAGCDIYILKKEQIVYAGKEEVMQYLSGIKEKDFEKEYGKMTNNSHFVLNGQKRYINETILAELQPAINKYKDMLSQIRNERENATKLKDKIEAEDNRFNVNHFHSIMKSQGDAFTDFPFTTDNSKYQKLLETIQSYLKVEQDYYLYVVKKEKTNLIKAKADSIKSIAGESSQIWQKYSKIIKKNYKYDFSEACFHLQLPSKDISDDEDGIYDKILDEYDNGNIRITKETLYKFIKNVDNGLIIANNCLDYVKVLPQFNTLKEAIAANQYFNFVKTKYDGTIASLGNGWNGQENGDGVRQQITKLEQYKNHIDNIATIEKNNERIVQLAEKAKNIKKIYTTYYNSIQKEYIDNSSAEYLTTIISNQNTIIAALEANDAKDIDKTVKKGKAETMEDIIRLLKQQ